MPGQAHEKLIEALQEQWDELGREIEEDRQVQEIASWDIRVRRAAYVSVRRHLFEEHGYLLADQNCQGDPRYWSSDFRSRIVDTVRRAEAHMDKGARHASQGRETG